MISIKKAAELTGIPERTIRHWCDSGKIKPVVKLGRAWIIDLSENKLKKLLAKDCR